MQSNQPRKPPIVTRPGETNELLLFLRNTVWLAGLLGQVRFHRALVQSYRRLARDAGRIDARHRPA